MTDYQVINPATGEEGKAYESLTDDQTEEVLTRFKGAFVLWRRTSRDDRANVLARVAELYDERADNLAGLITTEMGKTIKESLGEVELVAAI